MTQLLRRLTATVLALLATQFLLGMASNLYAQPPMKVPGVGGNFDSRLGAAARWALLHGPLELRAHVAIGLALGVAAIATTGVAFRTRTYPWWPLAPLGLFATAGAGLAGAAFLAYRQDDLYSLLMSVAFLADTVTYTALLLLDAWPTTRSRAAQEVASPRLACRPGDS